MSFFPEGFDPRADVVGVLDLVSIDTPDGLVRLVLGGDGRFTDIDGHVWWGSTLVGATDLEMSIGGTAPSGSLTLAYFQDPDAGELISEVRALGRDYIDGREVTFWIQVLQTMEDLYAPQVAPIRLAVRRATGLRFDVQGAMQRAITLDFEGPFAGRNTARGWTYCTADHARLTGAANPSLEFMPTDTWQDQKLFG